VALVLPADRSPPPPEPVGPPHLTPRAGRLLVTVLVTSLVTGLLAGALGSALGYTFATGDRATVLGAGAGRETLVRQPPDSVAAVVDRVLPSVVTVRSTTGGGRSLGSGFVVSADGYLITNDHVVGAGRPPTTVTFHDGTTSAAAVVGRHPESDIAVLKVDRAGLAPVSLGDSEAVAVGDPVLAIGSPLALSNTVTSGIVSATDRTIHSTGPGDEERYYAAIQTDAAVNQGNSGGPLVDRRGRVIGINSVIKSVAAITGGVGSIGLAFAIPIRHAKRIATEIIDTGHARRTVIGAELGRPVTAAGSGVRLVEVVAGGPAHRAGLRPADVLVRLDGRALEGPTDLVALVRKHDPGTVVLVAYRRGPSQGTAAVTLVADSG
jgi:putative serine protease PepD